MQSYGFLSSKLLAIQVSFKIICKYQQINVFLQKTWEHALYTNMSIIKFKEDKI